MTRAARTTTTPARAVLIWLEDAHTALDLGHALSDSMARALVATPDHPPAADALHPRTWYLEEYERVMRQQLRDPVPMAGPIALVDEWRDRQVQRSDRLAQLLDWHAECIALALAFVAREEAATARGVWRGTRPGARKTKRPGRKETSLDRAFGALEDAA